MIFAWIRQWREKRRAQRFIIRDNSFAELRDPAYCLSPLISPVDIQSLLNVTINNDFVSDCQVSDSGGSISTDCGSLG